MVTHHFRVRSRLDVRDHDEQPVIYDIFQENLMPDGKIFEDSGQPRMNVGIGKFVRTLSDM